MRPLFRISILALCLSAAASAVLAQTDQTLYAAPQRLVTLPDGRKINLVCQGSGAPTVILTAGAGGWSASWSAVQAGLAKRTLVCAWDRAGYGFSDASPQAQSVSNMTTDLEQALAGGALPGPYLMVAHSAGDFETLLFADRHPRSVAGMVLVDPTLPNLLPRVEAVSPRAGGLLRADLVMRVGAYRRCAAAPDHATAADAAVCFANPDFAKPLAAALSGPDHQPLRLLTRASLYEQFEANANAAANAARDYGNLPLVVLTSQTEPLAALPVEQLERTARLDALWASGHDEIAALSRSGVNRIVPGTTHSIQLEKPDAVIAAVGQVMDRIRAR